VTVWLLAGIGLLLALVPCATALLIGRTTDRIVALQLAGTVTVQAILVLAIALAEPGFADLALALVLLNFIGTLVFTHFLERWL
jgi:multisubunit Na+/H+ antiporter MnhF subunit